MPHRLRSCAIHALLLATLSYSGLCLLAWSMQRQLIFFPDPHVVHTPADLALTYQELSLKTSDGVLLHGWSIPPEKPDSLWVLHCHGNGGNISHRLFMVKLLHELGVGVVLFDYRGYGKSQGRLTGEADLVADGQAYLDELKKTVPSQRILLYGESLGGGVACALALRNECAGLILQSTFSSLTERAHEAFPILPTGWLLRYRLNSRAAVAQIKCPKLIMHSPQDEVIAYHHGRDLLEAAAEPKVWGELWGGHNDPALISLATPLQRFLLGIQGPSSKVDPP